jgi:hypothetical protein
MEKSYYIYIFLDPLNPGEFSYDELKFDYEPFYVGKGTGGRVSISKIANRSSPFKRNKILKIKNSGKEIISLIIYKDLNFEDSIIKEIETIKKIGRRDKNIGPLTNLTDGGEGRVNGKNSPSSIQKSSQSRIETNKRLREMGHDFTRSEEVKMKLREINMGEKNPMFGKTHTEEVKEAHSNRVLGTNHPMFGKKHNEETIQKIRDARSLSVDQDKMSELSRERNNKTVLQFSLDGEFIGEHESIKIASRDTGLSESIIGKTCRGQIKNPRTFIFKFKNEEDKLFINSYLIKVGDIYEDLKLVKRNKKSVVVEDVNQNIITLRGSDYPIFFEKKKL